MKAEQVLKSLADELGALLGRRLTGIYVHGSYAFGCFHPTHSDLDFLVVINEPVPLEIKQKMLEIILRLDACASFNGLEMSVLLKKYTLSFVHPCPYEFHYSRAHTKGAISDPEGYCRRMSGTDPDLAAHLTVVRSKGIVLLGEPVESVFGEVLSEDYMASLWYDAENAMEEIQSNPIYVILNLCRMAAYKEQGSVLSKKAGGEWGLTELPEQFCSMVQKALSAYAGGSDYQPEGSEQVFAAYMLQRIFEHEENVW